MVGNLLTIKSLNIMIVKIQQMDFMRGCKITTLIKLHMVENLFSYFEIH